MNNIPRPWLLLPMVVALGCCALSCRKPQQDTSPRDYLEQAFSELSKDPPPALDAEAQEKIQHLISELRENAKQKNFEAADLAEATKLGYRAFPAIAPLLRDPDPWVRSSTMGVLFRLDAKRSMPFLVGMLLDTGKIQYNDDDVFVDTIVARQAAGYLQAAFRGSLSFVTPLDELGQPQADERAEQRWWAYHLPYCDWRETVYGTQCWLNDQALYSHIPADRLAERLKSEPEKFKYVPVVWPQVSQYSRIVSRGQSLRLSLIFQNFGTEMPNPPNHPERGTDVFRLTGPDGREIPANPKLNEVVKNALIVPPVFTWNAYGWEIDLGDVYDISRPGQYRFYYRYLPPKSLRNSIYAQPLELQFWNGREYVNYCDFLVR